MEYQGQPIIILGMGRSGTSILANLLQSSDVAMYRNSIPSGEINPRGFAEEALVVAFHQKLKRLYYSRFEGDADYDNPLIDEIRAFECTEELKREAGVMVSRLQRPGLWGWKDPRTILFIDLWLTLLPTVRMLIPFRHPIELLASYLWRLPNRRLLRRGDQVFRSYATYHSKILQVVERHPEQCYVFYAQTAYRNLECLQNSLENFLGEKLRFSEAGDVFHREEFTDLGVGAPEHESFAKFFPATAAYFDNLNNRAVIPFPSDREQSKPRPELSALNSLAEYLDFPEDEADCVPLFLRMVAPTSQGYSTYMARQVDDLVEALAWLKQQVESNDSAMKGFQAMFEEREQVIRELESSKTYLVRQLEQHTHALEQQKHYVLELEKAKKYFITQLDQHARALAQQNEYIAELESAAACHRNQIAEQEEHIRALQSRKEAFRTLLGLRGTAGI